MHTPIQNQYSPKEIKYKRLTQWAKETKNDIDQLKKAI